ncbi:MAG: phosphoribosylglycinamide formyltransferase 2 [Flavobacteriales bacterium]|nr:phosphoribosylglycinamide formyltransferase 2 [Flavobacteriales bacterium]|tara:strand:+ start:415 stop:1575 length:1161 start_codon:yes stop_codon:yes gene_type:complete
MRKKILLLGSGELGKELVIAFQRLGQYVIAVDNYINAPAMQVAHKSEVINMLDGEELDRIVKKHAPDFIVPEVESIRTERLYDYEKQGYSVIPSAKAANFTMNRKSIRDLAVRDLNIKSAKYKYAKSYKELERAVKEIGVPCVVKPLMSSSGKGQSTVKAIDDIKHSWEYAINGSRGDIVEVIVEEYINFDYEITLLTLTQKTNRTLFCSPIGHRQERGDYQESWQPMNMDKNLIMKAQKMGKKITSKLTGNGIWGVEFFIKDNEVFFSELSPRPHDTGMVTLAGTQIFSQFELHARAILGIPVTEIKLLKNGASAVILANENNNSYPLIQGLEESGVFANTEVRIFGKPNTKKYRRMGVALAAGKKSVKELVKLAKKSANCIQIN